MKDNTSFQSYNRLENTMGETKISFLHVKFVRKGDSYLIMEVNPPLGKLSLRDLDRIIRLEKRRSFIVKALSQGIISVAYTVIGMAKREKINRIARDFIKALDRLCDVLEACKFSKVREHVKTVLREFSKVPKEHRAFVLKELKLMPQRVEREDTKGHRILDVLSMYRSLIDVTFDIELEKAKKGYYPYEEHEKVKKEISKYYEVVELIEEMIDKLQLMAKGYVRVNVKLKDQTIIQTPLKELWRKLNDMEV